LRIVAMPESCDFSTRPEQYVCHETQRNRPRPLKKSVRCEAPKGISGTNDKAINKFNDLIEIHDVLR
jgi:hypothetical protein